MRNEKYNETAQYNNNCNNDLRLDNIKKYLLEHNNTFEDMSNYINILVKRKKNLCNNNLNNFNNLVINIILKSVCNEIKNNYTQIQLINTIYSKIKNSTLHMNNDNFFSYLCLLEYIKDCAKKDNYIIYIQLLDICISILIVLNCNNSVNNILKKMPNDNQNPIYKSIF